MIFISVIYQESLWLWTASDPQDDPRGLFFRPSEFQVFHGHGKIWHQLKSWLMLSQLYKWLDVTRYFCWNPHLWWLNLVKSRNCWWLNPPSFETPMVFGSSESSALRLVNLVSPVADLTCDIKKEAPSQMMGWYGGDLVRNPKTLGLQWDNWLVVWNILYFSIYWEESSQLTNSYFSEGFKPPTSYIYSSNSWALLYHPGYDTQEKRRGLLETTLW